MDVQEEREWNRRIRGCERQVEDAKRARRLFVLAIVGFIAFTAAWVVFAVILSPEFAWFALVTLWGGAGITWWGNTEMPFDTVRGWERKTQDLREDYTYAMMEA